MAKWKACADSAERDELARILDTLDISKEIREQITSAFFCDWVGLLVPVAVGRYSPQPDGKWLAYRPAQRMWYPIAQGALRKEFSQAVRTSWQSLTAICPPPTEAPTDPVRLVAEQRYLAMNDVFPVFAARAERLLSKKYDPDDPLHMWNNTIQNLGRDGIDDLTVDEVAAQLQEVAPHISENLFRLMPRRLPLQGQTLDLNTLVARARTECDYARFELPWLAPPPRIVEAMSLAPWPSLFADDASAWSAWISSIVPPSAGVRKFLRAVTGGSVDQERSLCVLMGLVLAGDNSTKSSYYCLGPSNSGKSTFQNLLALLLTRDMSCPLPASTLFISDGRRQGVLNVIPGQPQSQIVVQPASKRLAWTDDVPPNSRVDAGFLLQTTGLEAPQFVVRAPGGKKQALLTIPWQATLMSCLNFGRMDFEQIYATDGDAMRTRITVIPFLTTLVSADHLAHKTILGPSAAQYAAVPNEVMTAFRVPPTDTQNRLQTQPTKSLLDEAFLYACIGAAMYCNAPDARWLPDHLASGYDEAMRWAIANPDRIQGRLEPRFARPCAEPQLDDSPGAPEPPLMSATASPPLTTDAPSNFHSESVVIGAVPQFCDSHLSVFASRLGCSRGLPHKSGEEHDRAVLVDQVHSALRCPKIRFARLLFAHFNQRAINRGFSTGHDWLSTRKGRRRARAICVEFVNKHA